MVQALKQPGKETRAFTASSFEVGNRAYSADELLEDFIKHLMSRNVQVENVLLTGVTGTKRLLKDRTHGDRYTTFGVPLGVLVDDLNRGLVPLDDPFRYAEMASTNAPTIAVYDLEHLLPMHLKNDASKRYEEDMGRLPDPNTYGLPGTMTLDDITKHAVLLKP